jgi:hypothetical protein
MKKAEDNKKMYRAEKSLNDLQSQKIENGKSIKGGKGTATEETIGKSSKTSAG